jgi:hypothetical protein
MIDRDARQYDIASLAAPLYPVAWVGELWTAVHLEGGRRILHGYPARYVDESHDRLARSIVLDYHLGGRLERICTTAVQVRPAREVQP